LLGGPPLLRTSGASAADDVTFAEGQSVIGSRELRDGFETLRWAGPGKAVFSVSESAGRPSIGVGSRHCRRRAGGLDAEKD
jgi:hypothetical protein